MKRLLANVLLLAAAIVPWQATCSEPTHVFFVHGANVSERSARGWASEMFKRLHQAGAVMIFTPVTWYSDAGPSYNYQANVSNAFVTAPRLATAVNEVSGRRVVIAHSLGTLVAASAIQDHGMQVDKLIMLNSAIPAEAFVPSMSDASPSNKLVHCEWTGYTNACWASCWNELFSSPDARTRLTWKGRFAGVKPVAFNFYSSGDEVLELYALAHNPAWDDGFNSSDGWGRRFSWQKQELYKGRKAGIGSIGTTDWSGWGFASNWLGVRIWSEDDANAVVDFTVFQTNAVFNLLPPSITNAVATRFETDCHLALGIPALSPPVGSIDLSDYDLPSLDMNSAPLKPVVWPVEGHGGAYSNRWLHSDIKNVAFPYVCGVFRKIVEIGELQ